MFSSKSMFDTILRRNWLSFIILSRFQLSVIVEHCKQCDGSIGNFSTIDFNTLSLKTIDLTMTL